MPISVPFPYKIAPWRITPRETAATPIHIRRWVCVVSIPAPGATAAGFIIITSYTSKTQRSVTIKPATVAQAVITREVAVIGAGAMGEAMIGGLLNKKAVEAKIDLQFGIRQIFMNVHQCIPGILG